MTRHFSIPTILRMTPNGLLEQFFTQLQTPLLSMNWKKLGKRQIEPLLLAISWLPATDQARVEATLGTIHELACTEGWQTILEAAQQWGLTRELIDSLGSVSPYAKAMRVWLDYPEVFQQASLVQQVDGLTRWRKRTGLPLVKPRITDESRRELAVALSACLRREEGRGQHCTVDYLRRRDGADVFVAYPDDFMQAILEHDPQGRLRPRSYRPTFEIVYAYHAERGVLELYAKVTSRLKPILENLFGQIILGIDLSSHPGRRPWDLNRLKDRYFCLETDPVDEVSASICRLRLDVPHCGRLTVEPHRRDYSNDVFDVIDECLNDERVSWNDVDISMATFRFEFGGRSNRSPETLTFDVSAPDYCSIKSRRPERIELTHKYLRRWRIANV